MGIAERADDYCAPFVYCRDPQPVPALDLDAALADIERRPYERPSPLESLRCGRPVRGLVYNSTMVSLDFRTRTDDDILAVDTREFFTEQLPELIATRREYVMAGARELGLAPFTFVTPAGTWTLGIDGDSIVVRADDDGAAVVRLTDEDVADIVNDLKTPMTFLTGGRLEMTRGNLGNFLDWWVVLRSLIDARPVHARGDVAFRDSDGAPLDLHRAFGPEDDDADIAHFLAEAGFLHLRGWFDPEQMRDQHRHGRRAPRYVRDDGNSWWARTPTARSLRAHAFVPAHSPATQSLLASDRYRRIGGLTADDYRMRERQPDRSVGEAIGVVEGISDVPRHTGLLARDALVSLLRPHRRHIGHRRRRTLGPVARRRRVTPRARATRVRPLRVGPASRRPADDHR
jgi:hypothetical protein